MPDVREIERELQALEAELKRLEAEYNMFFAGRLPRPPWETRSRVEKVIKRLDRQHIGNYGDRFRFTTLQTRYAKFVDLWDRGLRAREEGRPGPFRQAEKPAADVQSRPPDRIMHVTTFQDPTREVDKLLDLYDRLAEARRETGQDAIPFHKFAELIKTQVSALSEKGTAEVAFRVAVKEGKVAFTARAMKGAKDDE
ncbi:MAG TPA: MXAN_5187 C-terminal domain-containing protein [Vicinamibacterales bacterium]